MKRMSIKLILLGSRPWSLPMFIVTYLIGVLTGFYYSKMFGLYLILLIIMGAIGELLIHMMTNIINDYYDYIKNIDKENNVKRLHLILNSNMKPEDVKKISLILGIIGLIIGIFIAIINRPWAILLGFIGFIMGLEYSAPPLHLKYYALGDFSVIVSMLLLTLAGFYIYTGKISILGILIGLPIALLIDDVLMANNIRDINRDKASAKTLPVILGYNKSKYLYIFFIILSYVVLAFLIVFKTFPIYTLIEILTLPQAINIIKDALKDNFDFLDVKNAKLVSNFGILFFVSLIIYIIIKII